VRAELPLVLGVVPFGMIYGVLALGAGLTHTQAQGMSSIVFAGSAQFITTQLVKSAAPGLIIVLTILVVNLRHALYSASLAPHVQHLPLRWKLILSYLLTDEAYAPTISNYEEPGEATHKHWFFLGAGLALWSGWQLSTAAGITLGAVVPESWSLDFTLALTFIALVVPRLRDRSTLASALVAGSVALAGFFLPYKLGILAAAMSGILAGTLLEGQK
jgi:4-azaleucine resistance transporter AzlC